MFFEAANNIITIKKLISDHLETVIAVGSTVMTGIKTVSEHSQSRSALLSKRNQEVERAAHLAGSYEHFVATRLEQQHKELLQQQIEEQLRECVSAIEQLNSKLDEGEKDPNWHLATWKRVLLWFKPSGWREFVPHLLSYVCFAVGLGFAVQLALHQVNHQSAHPMLTVIFLAFAVVFHYWCLDERRRDLGYRKKMGRVSQFLLIQAPENARMLLAQILFFLCATLTTALAIVMVADYSEISTLENIVLAVAGFLFALMYTAIFHGWAIAELRHWEEKPQLVSSFRALFRGFFRRIKQSGWAKMKFIFACGMSILPMLLVFFFIMAAATSSGGDLVFVAVLLGAMAILLIPVYAALRTVKINYSLSHAKDFASEDQAIAATASAKA